jgi:hypothetical protein
LGGPFGGEGETSKIFIKVNSDNKIIEIKFLYSKAVDFYSMVESYKNTIGSPTISKGKAIWKDSKTKFIIYQNEGEEVTTELVDSPK